MINKIIHYCWFGRNELPESAVKCIESWKKYCPDYEIKEWNEDNFDLNSCDYVREAYAAKKWAFVSDYARFKILYEYGGMYFDTDVEMVKPFDQLVLAGPFMGFEAGKNEGGNMLYEVNPGLGLAAEKGMPIIKEILDYYHSIHFTDQNGGQNTTTIVQYTTDTLKKHGLKSQNTIQKVAGFTIYPQEYFCPLDFNTGKMNMTENTHSIHHYVASWFSTLDWYIVKLERAGSHGGKLKNLLCRLLRNLLRFVRKVKQRGIRSTLRIIMDKMH